MRANRRMKLDTNSALREAELATICLLMMP